ALRLRPPGTDGHPRRRDRALHRRRSALVLLHRARQDRRALAGRLQGHPRRPPRRDRGRRLPARAPGHDLRDQVMSATEILRGQRANKAAANPTPAQILRAREEAGLTQQAAAALVHTSWHSWSKWETSTADENHRRMHPSTWELFQVKLAAMTLRKKQELSPS